MFWLGLGVGFLLGGNLGAIIMALLQSNREEKYQDFLAKKQ